MESTAIMKEYNFEFTDTKFTLKLIGITALIFFLLIILTFLNIKLIGIVPSLIISFSIPILIFWMNKNKIKKQGSAIIQDAYSDFKLPTFTKRILFHDIESYQIERYEGTKLKIKLKDNGKIKVLASESFCNPNNFEIFCQDLDNKLQSYKKQNNVELVKRKSFFEQVWILPLLIILSLGGILGIISAVILDKNIPIILYGSLAILLSLWVGYYNATKKND